MPKHQILMGAATAALCAVGIWQSGWIARNTRKGQWLARRCGERRAITILRCLFILGVVFGVLLATNIIQPIAW